MEPALAGILKASPGLHDDAKRVLETSSADIASAVRECNRRYKTLARLHPLAYMVEDIKEACFKYLTDTNELAKWCYGAVMFGAVGPCPLGAADAGATHVTITETAAEEKDFEAVVSSATAMVITDEKLCNLHEAHKENMLVDLETYIARGRERMRANNTAATTTERADDHDADKYAHPKATPTNVSDAYAGGYLSGMFKTVVDFVASTAGGPIENVYKLVRPTQADLQAAHLRDFANRYHYPHLFARVVANQIGPIVQPMRASMAHRWSNPDYVQPIVTRVGSTAEIPYRIEPLGESNPSAVIVDLHTAAFIEDCIDMILEVMEYAIRGHHGEVTAFVETIQSILGPTRVHEPPPASNGMDEGESQAAVYMLNGESPNNAYVLVPPDPSTTSSTDASDLQSMPTLVPFQQLMPTPASFHIPPRGPAIVEDADWDTLTTTGPDTPDSCNRARLDKEPMMPVPMPFYEEEGIDSGELPTRAYVKAMLNHEKPVALPMIMACGARGWQFYELDRVPMSTFRQERPNPDEVKLRAEADAAHAHHLVSPRKNGAKVQRAVMEMFHTHLDSIANTAAFKRGYETMRPVYRIMCGWAAHYMESRAYCIDRRGLLGADYPVPTDTEYKIIEFSKAPTSMGGYPVPGPCQDALSTPLLGSGVRIEGVHIAGVGGAYVAAILIDLLSLGRLQVTYPAQDVAPEAAPVPWALSAHRMSVDGELYALQELHRAKPIWPRNVDKPGEVAIIPVTAAVASVAAAADPTAPVPALIKGVVSAIKKADAASRVFSEAPIAGPADLPLTGSPSPIDPMNNV